MSVGQDLAQAVAGKLDKACLLMHAASKNTGVKTKEQFVPVRVQYNPNSIALSGERDFHQNKDRTVAAETSGKYRQEDVYPVNMVLHTDLIFDAVQLADAFSAADAGKYSETGAVRTIAEKVCGTHSVQDMAELFVAAVCSAYTSAVCFSWGKQMFWGVLTKADVQYTMFNRAGNPIRAKVSIEIRQDTIRQTGSHAVNSELRYATQREWEQKFQQMFLEGGRLATNKELSGSSKTVSKFLNFR